MRIMDCVLILFRGKLSTVMQDPEKLCPVPSWSESLKVTAKWFSSYKNLLKDSHNKVDNNDDVYIGITYSG